MCCEHGRCAAQYGREPGWRQPPRAQKRGALGYGSEAALTLAPEPLPYAALLIRAHNYKEKAGNYVTARYLLQQRRIGAR